jgi:hypothetical protein
MASLPKGLLLMLLTWTVLSVAIALAHVAHS